MVHRRQFQDIECTEIIQLYLLGYSLEDLAEKFLTNPIRIKSLLTGNGISIRSKGRKSSLLPELNKKRCSGKCKQILPLSAFYKNISTVTRRSYECKACIKERLGRKRFPAITKYNLSYTQYRQMCEGQEFKCLICQEKPKRLCIDHDHATNKVRGLLCAKCNSGIGLLGDSASNILRAAKYLNAHRSM
jgi:hypothetical protein